jgi:hypothetical protein
MSIKDIILFCSTTSQASIPCLKFIQQHRLPVKVVRLDTQELRDRASRGKYFQVVTVPNLVVLYNDNNLQQFVGRDKIIRWFTNIIQQNNRPPHVAQPVFDEESSSEEEEPVRRRRKPKKKKVVPKPKKKYQKIRKESSSEEEGSSGDEIEVYEEDETPPPPSTQGLIVGSNAPKPSSGSSVFDVAKEMEKQRKQSLSFDKD